MWSFFSRDSSKDFHFDIGDSIQSLEERSIWSIHRGKKKGAPEEVSIFVFDVKSNSDACLDIAKASVKRLKTLRHPSILTYVDSYESEKVVYLATEWVEPLAAYLERIDLDGQQRDLYISWGLFQITRALSFLNNDGNLRHNNVNLWSVFVNASGEWKLGGVEYVSSVSESASVCKLLPKLDIYNPPEVNDHNRIKFATKCSTDMWGLGCLIWEVFNGALTQPSHLKSFEKIPKQLTTLFCELVGSNPTSRPNPADIISRCRKVGGYFKNDLVDTLLFLEEIQIKDKNEKGRFFSNLTPHLDNFPDSVCKHKILPQLITAFDYGDAGSAVLAPMFKLGRLLDDAEYQKKIVPCVVKLFASNDRATRSRLLQQLDHFIGHLQSNTINEQLFTQIAHGFMDTNPTIREQTVKSVIHLAPKLNYNNLNVEVLRHFARLQAKDDQGGIRTNTTVCLGKIAQHLHPQIRQKVLISAFARAMRDPFPPARNAGVLALAATQQYYLLNEVAHRILPSLCPLTVDPEKMVRDSAFRTIKGFLGKLEKVSEDPTLRESMEADVNTATPSLSNAAATWAGWAVTAVTAKFYRSQSDTVRSMNNPLSTRMLSKPASLEQPSSSSISTTTSSVTSMTSLEHEENSRGNESLSDYDCGHWGDTDNWGEIDPGGHMVASSSGSGSGAVVTSDALSPRSPETSIQGTDDWDNEDWGSLEEEPEEEENTVETWSSIETTPVIRSTTTSTVIVTDNNSFMDNSQWDNNWNNEDHNSNHEERINHANNATQPTFEEARRKLNERKLMRQKEMELKGFSRGGPMKLGAKKI